MKKNNEPDINYTPDTETNVRESEEDGEIEPVEKIKKLKNDLHACLKLQKEYLDGWQRAKADYINYKKEEEKRFRDFSRFAVEGIIHDSITVLDSFDLALKYDMPDTVRKGMLLIKSQLEDIFKRYGFEEIRSLGEKFNPEIHESLGESISDKESGTVVEEIQRGYSLNGKVIRPARVKIAQ